MRPETLTDLRRRLGWTHKICARYLQIGITTWISWEKGTYGPKPENARRLRAMIELSQTDDGAALLKTWADDDARRRAARRQGRHLHQNSKLGA